MELIFQFSIKVCMWTANTMVQFQYIQHTKHTPNTTHSPLDDLV